MRDVSAIIEEMRQMRRQHVGAQPSSLAAAIKREYQEEQDAKRRERRRLRWHVIVYFASKRRRREARHQCHLLGNRAYFTARSRYWRPS